MCAFYIMFTTELEQRGLPISQQNEAPLRNEQLRTYCTHARFTTYSIRGAFVKYCKSCAVTDCLCEEE